jgi:hypothetical protein
LGSQLHLVNRVLAVAVSLVRACIDHRLPDRRAVRRSAGVAGIGIGLLPVLGQGPDSSSVDQLTLAGS